MPLRQTLEPGQRHALVTRSWRVAFTHSTHSI